MTLRGKNRMTDIQEGLNTMSMQDTINEIYRMRQEADDRERQEMEDKIKQCDLNMLASSKDKSEPDEEFPTVELLGVLLELQKEHKKENENGK